LDHAVEGKLAVGTDLPMPHAVTERAVDEPPARRGAVQPADLERRLVEVLDLEDLAGLPVPRHDLVTHLVHRRVAGFDGMGMRPARSDDQVQLRLDPDVVHVVGRGMRFEEVAVVVELHQRARRAAFFRAEHRDHHATRHGIEGVGSREAGARGEVRDRLDELRVLGIGGDVVDEQSVREQPTSENPIGVGGIAEMVRFVPGRPGGRRGDHLSIARRRWVGVEHREEVGVLLIGVAGPDVQQGLVLAWGKAPDEYRLVRGADRRGGHHEAQRQDGEQEQQGGAVHNGTSSVNSRVRAKLPSERQGARRVAASPPSDIFHHYETLPRAGELVRLDFSGAPEIAAPPAEVWKRLLDHEFVASVAPGVESVEPIDDRHFKVISGFGVGAVKVRFQLDVELSDVKPPTSLKMSAHGKAPGSGVDVSTMLEIELIPPNRSRLKWSASSEVRGTVASVGARLLKGTAQKLTESFWDKFAARVGEAAGSK